MRCVRLWLVCCFLVLSATLVEARAELISGRVLGPDEKPAPQAEVWFQSFGEDADGKYRALPLNEAGEFQVEATAASYSPDFFGRILVYQAGFAPSGGSLNRVSSSNLYQLRPPLPLSGRVLDENGKPIAGAQISLNHMNDSEAARLIYLNDSPIEEKFIATTNETGDWKLDAGIANANISITVSAPRFANAQQFIIAGQETVIRLKPGAAISGRVVYEDGRPAARLKIRTSLQNQFSGDFSWGEAKSGADGTFQIDGLSAGPFTVYVSEPNKDWVSMNQSAVAVAGETKPVPDLVLAKGVLIEGTVADENGAPVSGAHVISQNNQSSISSSNSAISDENGVYRLRVLPGKIKMYLSGKPAEFLYPEIGSPQKMLEVTVAENENKKVPFVLKRGLTMSGTVTDAEGAPVAGVLLKLSPVLAEHVYSMDEASAKSDEVGNWKAVGLKPGKWKLEASGDWATAAPVEIVAPSAAPVNVRVQQQQYFTLRGRVVSHKGEPLAGVGLKFAVYVPQGHGGMMFVRSVVSDEQGWYEINKLKGVETVTFQSADKAGFRFSKGGLLLENPGKATYSDVVMAPMNAKLAGRVLDAQKQPVANARVSSPNAEPKAVATTDAEGNFVLENLAQGFVHVVAQHPEKGAVVSRQISDGSNVELRLTPSTPVLSPDTARAEKILWEIAQYENTRPWSVLLAVDFEKAMQLAADADGKLPDAFIARAIAFLSKRDPAKAVQWGLPLLDEIKADWTRASAITDLALAAADENPQLAQSLYERLRATNPGEDWAALMHSLYLAKLAIKLHHPGAQMMVNQLLQAGQTSPLNSRGQRDFGAMLAESLVEVDISEARRVYETLQGEEKTQGLQRIIGALAERGDAQSLEAALELLDQAANGDQNAEGQFGFSANKLIRVLGKTDPAAALALARRVTYSHSKPQALADAALAQPDDAAAGVLLREAGTAAVSQYAAVAQLAQIAILAQPKFPDLARELAAQALRLHQEKKNDPNTIGLTSGSSDEVQNLAIALALTGERIAARELLEFEWLETLERTQRDPQQRWSLRGIVRGMANVDFDRALQMANAIPVDDKRGIDVRYDTLRQLARWLLAPEAARPLLWSDWRRGEQSEY